MLTSEEQLSLLLEEHEYKYNTIQGFVPPVELEEEFESYLKANAYPISQMVEVEYVSNENHINDSDLPF